jgi:[acyl-carrier-protein] S-malonyltransferase
MKALTAAQVENPVRWQETVENMIAAGADTFIECGPGKTLMGLIGKISKDVRVFHVEDEATLKETLEAVK